MEPKGGDTSFLAFLLSKQHGSGDGLTAGSLLVPAILKAGDTDRDGHISGHEFRALGEKWFTDWDTTNSGRLVLAQVRAGLTAALAQDNTNSPTGAKFWLEGDQGKPNGLASAMGIEFEYVHADLEFERQLFTNIAVRYKGNGTFVESRGTLKRSLKPDSTNLRARNLRISENSIFTIMSPIRADERSLSYALLAMQRLLPRTAYARIALLFSASTTGVISASTPW
jgi:hypothetical protein